MSTKCIINELAKIVSEDQSIKAVWLDSIHKKASFAFEEGMETIEKRQQLEEIVLKYKPHEDPQCIKETWDEVKCLCEEGTQKPLPSNVRLVTIAGAGILIEKINLATLRCTWRWHQFNWVHLKPRQFTLPSQLINLSEWKMELGLTGLCGSSALVGILLENQLLPFPFLNPTFFYLLAYIAGGYFPFKETFELLRKGILDVHFLMLCVALGAAFIGHWWEGATLLFLFSLSGALEDMAMANTEREIKSLFKTAPKTAVIVQENGSEAVVNVEDLKVGMNLRVRPGELFPVDSKVIKGVSAANESNLTGESLPVEKKVGDHVFSGTINLWGSVDCKILKLANESVLAKIIELIQKAQESKAPSQRFTDKFSSGYTYLILAMSLMMFFVWWLFFNVPPFMGNEHQTSAFYRAMTLLVVASPCALVLSIPSAILAGIAAGAKGGVLFRGGVAIEKLAEINRVALDKTGTLTTGDLKVIKINSYPAEKERELLRIAASLGHHSTHPISQAIVKAYLDQGGNLVEVFDFESKTGSGLEATMLSAENNQKIKISLGKRAMFEGQEWLKTIALPEIGVSEIIVHAHDIKGQILLLDQVRQASAPLLKDMLSRGIKVSMLTGDRPEAANLIAKSVGITDVHAGIHPNEKVSLIQDWQSQGEKVAMVGDGVNDAPSLAASHVGIGMGLRGSAAVLEQADIVLMQDKLENFIFAFNLSQKARRIIQQNLIISLGVIIVLVLSALGSALPLTLGVIGHEGSTVIVVLNSLRLLIFAPASKQALVK